MAAESGRRIRFNDADARHLGKLEEVAARQESARGAVDPGLQTRIIQLKWRRRHAGERR